jgi:hypothetical protein
LLEAARLYDPQVRRWLGRLVFGNGVLLFGPVVVTAKLAGQASLPPGTAVAWYVRPSGGPSRRGRTNAGVLGAGELLVLGHGWIAAAGRCTLDRRSGTAR